MKAKKLLALCTAISLVALPTSSAFAESITGVTTVNYVDPLDYITVLAPTSESIGFTLDPQGLASIEGVGDWDPAAGGNILPQAVGIIVNKSAAPVQASISFSLTDDADTPVTLLDSNAAINDDTNKNMYLTITPADDKVVATVAQIDAAAAPTYFQLGDPLADKEFSAADLVGQGLDGSSANVKILADAATASFGDYVCQADAGTIADAAALQAYDFAADADSITFKQVEIPAHIQIDATTNTTVSQFNDGASGFADATDKVVLADSGTGLAYKMNKADFYAANTGSNNYELRLYSYDYATVKSDNYDTASFVIGGNINKNADWSDYTTGGKAITLAATYTFNTITADEYTNAAVVGDSYNNIAYTAPTAPSIATATYDIAADTAEDVTVSLGQGGLAATGITSIVDADANTLTETTDYTLTDTTLSFTTAYVNSIVGDGSADVSKVLTVTFNDTAATTATITLTYGVPDVAPSVTTNTINFSKAAPADAVINYTLGSGASGATAVSQVYIDGPSGKFELMSLYPDYVTVTGSTVTVKSTWLTNYASGATAKIYVRYDMTSEEALATDFTTPECTISIVD